MELQIPKTLSDVITQHKDELTLSITDIGKLKAMVDRRLDGQLRGEIRPSYLIELIWYPDSEKEKKDIHVLGEHVSLKSAYATSRIVSASLDLSKVRTLSGSIYNISNITTSEPPQNLLLHMCATLNCWRLGRYFGVLDVFY
ncbi:conserved hypothetical protein [Candidatus Terasakiella magnetica]|uniref:Uncharacterized protein n=1 Tax=Candidatus Terasakiella magnetica TaxID=1867952 RepID=A0A1C3RHB0_9PROT|nr:hypothetical protein [Candidatus Terasakiella magnetica]SCA56665.1 conserved hypothetical protein [Candidatus Terasakiella magnetica]